MRVAYLEITLKCEEEIPRALILCWKGLNSPKPHMDPKLQKLRVKN